MKVVVSAVLCTWINVTEYHELLLWDASAYIICSSGSFTSNCLAECLSWVCWMAWNLFFWGGDGGKIKEIREWRAQIDLCPYLAVNTFMIIYHIKRDPHFLVIPFGRVFPLCLFYLPNLLMCFMWSDTDRCSLLLCLVLIYVYF